MLKMRKKH